MRSSKMLLAAVFLVATAATAQAQATRTWVSGVGDDANPCSRTAPCKTFAGAISKTVAGGEIDALDPGGFGALTITKAITLRGDGITAGVLVSGTDGITVNAGSTDDVIIKGLDINGIGTGLNGIKILSARSVAIDATDISWFTKAGIDVEPTAPTTTVQVTISHSTVRDTPTGLNVASTATPASLALVHDSEFFTNVTTGIMATGAGAKVGLSNATVSTLSTASKGTILSYKNNVIGAGTPSSTLPLK